MTKTAVNLRRNFGLGGYYRRKIDSKLVILDGERRWICARSLGLKKIPQLPYNLIELDCSNNNLSYLPQLPNSLTDLQCHNNGVLMNLPQLPKSLIILYCYYNKLINLPQIHPNNLKELFCFLNKLTKLQKVNKQIKRLEYDSNMIKFIFEYNINLFYNKFNKNLI